MKNNKSWKILSVILAFFLIVAFGYIIELKDGKAFNKSEITPTEIAAASPTPAAAAEQPKYRVNINTADITELCKIKGIGKATAKKIIEYRTEHGEFQSVNDLLYIKGIGKKNLDKFRNEVCIE